MSNTESASHQSRVAKNLFYSFGISIGSNVEIVDFLSQQQIAYSTAAKVGKMSRAVQAVEDL